MAPENAPVLFPPRLTEGKRPSQPHHGAGTRAISTQLVQTIAATLGCPDALPRLTEVLGLQLAADACLILRFHQVSQTLYYSFWRPGEPVQFWSLSTKSPRPQDELQCRVARGLIDHGPEPSDEPDSLPWREGLASLLSCTEQPQAWLNHIQTCETLPVTSAPDMDGVVLLLYRSGLPQPRLNRAQEIEIAGLLAIALHQHYLQYQAQRSSEQLTYLNYLKEDFLSTLNHELRTPLTSMMLGIRMLRRPDLTPERAAMYLDILEQQCSREINLVNDLLMLQSVSARQPQAPLEEADLVSLLNILVNREQGQLTRANLELRLELPEQPVMMAISENHLKRVLQELLTNACKYAAPNSTVTLGLVDRLAIQQSVELSITNTGAGISPEEQPHIFEKFRRGHHATKHAIPGTGTGLALVKGLLEQVSGTISVQSRPLNERLWQTCFTIELPNRSEAAKCGQICPER